MWKRLALVIGVAMTGTGIFLVYHEQARNKLCNLENNQIVGSHISNECLDIAAYYFTGFLLLIVGLLVVVFGLLMARRSKKFVVVRHEYPDFMQKWDDPRTGPGGPRV